MAHSDILLPIQPTTELPIVRSVDVRDLTQALRRGADDFAAMPTHAIFLCAIYPLAGLLIYSSVFAYDLVHLLYPLAFGFALLGPFAGIGLYELSRRRELGLDTSWTHAFDVLRSPSLASILGVGAFLLVIFGVWLEIAHSLYSASFGHGPLTPYEFVRSVFTRPEGLTLVVVGNAIGILLGLMAASISVISLPLLLDRNVGFAVAVQTSVRVVVRNPVAMAAWFVFVATALLIASLPAFVGLAVVLPILGHATWHLYRIALEPDAGARPDLPIRRKGIRYAADFPASLFTRSRSPDDGPAP
jgi:uncharacterized membrane protein